MTAKPKQVFQISSQNNLQYSSNTISYSGNFKPSQTFKISSSHQNATSNSSNIIFGKSKAKTNFPDIFMLS